MRAAALKGNAAIRLVSRTSVGAAVLRGPAQGIKLLLKYCSSITNNLPKKGHDYGILQYS